MDEYYTFETYSFNVTPSLYYSLPYMEDTIRNMSMNDLSHTTHDDFLCSFQQQAGCDKQKRLSRTPNAHSITLYFWSLSGLL